jgi:hypothetical protein
VEIRYFTSGITWSATYVGIANQDESRLQLTGYVRVENGSGELYENAQTRLVVGTINLVEKIADLANRPPPGIPYAKRSAGDRENMRLEFDGLVARGGAFGGGGMGGMGPMKPKEVIKQGLSEYFLFTIDGREDIRDQEPKRLVALQVADVPLECLYKLSDRDGGPGFTKIYRFQNVQLRDDDGRERELPAMENLGLSPLPDGTVQLFSEYANHDLAYIGGTQTKYVAVGDRVEVTVGGDSDITISRKLKDQAISNVVARQYERRLDDDFVQRYDLLDYDETMAFEETIISGKPVPVKVEVERHFDAQVVLWSEAEPPGDWNSDRPGAYADLHQVPGRVERVDENHVKYFLDLQPGEKTTVTYRVTYKRRKVGPELNVEKIRRRL